MDRWDDDDTFRVARDLHSGPVMSASHQTTTANCGLAATHIAALDALIETAWSFPGFRVSFGAFEGTRAIRFHTSAGAESQAALDCVRIDLSEAPRFVEALRASEAPVAFEDAQSDSRCRPIAEALQEIGCGSMLILPLQRQRKLVGLVMIDRESPRTWGVKESAALDRLAPLISLTLEHVEAKAELESTRTNGARNERRITAIRGLTAGVAKDAQRILGAMRGTVDNDRQATHSLLGQLERLVEELDRVQRSPLRLTEPFELSATLRELAPGLRAISRAKLEFVGLSEQLVGVHGNRTGIERLLVNVLAHASRHASNRESVTIELRCAADDRPQLRLSGDGLEIDEALSRMGGDDALIASAQLRPGLWQARCEALLQDIRVRVEDQAVVLEFPTADLEIDAAKTCG